jgi:hypothetical protein
MGHTCIWEDYDMVMAKEHSPHYNHNVLLGVSLEIENQH